MITVQILINEKVIYCRSAVNKSPIKAGIDDVNIYKNDDGTIIKHTPKDGAVVLAKKMLDTIKEEL